MQVARRRSASSGGCFGARKERCDGTGAPALRAEELQCSICFDVLTFPVTLPCGHNFDRGCILAAWACQARREADPDGDAADSDSDDNHAEGIIMQPVEPSLRRTPRRQEDSADTLCAHSCPLCRQSVWLSEPKDELRLNQALQGIVSSLFPLESARDATPDKQQPRARGRSDDASQPRALPPLDPDASRIIPGRSNHSSNGLVEFLRQPSLRTLSSLLSVWVASLYTIPPGFTLALLLLMALTAIACAPPASFGVATSSAASPLLLLTLEALDQLCNGLGLLIRDLSLQLDRPLALAVHLVAVLW